MHAILIPSLNRPQRLRMTTEVIHANTPEPHRILWCVADDASKAILDELGEWYLDDAADPDRRYVTRMNKLVRHLSPNEETVFFGSDDVIHHPKWLTKALVAMAEGPAVVVVNDCHNSNGTQAVVRRDYLERAVFDAPGEAFHGGYHHNFADNEQHFTALKQGEYGRAMDSYVEHLHPLFQSHNAIPWDTTYRVAMDGWQHDEHLFAERAALIESHFA